MDLPVGQLFAASTLALPFTTKTAGINRFVGLVFVAGI